MCYATIFNVHSGFLFLILFHFRIAANEPSFMSMQLKILDQRHKQKLNLKALDAVLFGPPLREYTSYFKTVSFCGISLHQYPKLR